VAGGSGFGDGGAEFGFLEGAAHSLVLFCFLEGIGGGGGSRGGRKSPGCDESSVSEWLCVLTEGGAGVGRESRQFSNVCIGPKDPEVIASAILACLHFSEPATVTVIHEIHQLITRNSK
jgi:hypothetical protein